MEMCVCVPVSLRVHASPRSRARAFSGLGRYETPAHAYKSDTTGHTTKQAVMWMRAFADPNWKWDYFINLSAADIPIVPVEEIEVRDTHMHACAA